MTTRAQDRATRIRVRMLKAKLLYLRASRSRPRTQIITTSEAAVLCVTPSCEALHNNMKAFGEKLSNNPDAARDFLKRAGIVTSDGVLAKAYGG